LRVGSAAPPQLPPPRRREERKKARAVVSSAAACCVPLVASSEPHVMVGRDKREARERRKHAGGQWRRRTSCGSAADATGSK
jgi:hypothetical protein